MSDNVDIPQETEEQDKEPITSKTLQQQVPSKDTAEASVADEERKRKNMNNDDDEYNDDVNEAKQEESIGDDDKGTITEEKKRKGTINNSSKNPNETSHEGKDDNADPQAENDDDNENDHSADEEEGDADAETDGDESDSEQKKQSGTLPPRPIKRARTAYFIFTDEKRPVVQAEHPGEGVAVVARIMGQMWSSLSTDEKEKYQQLASLERDRVAKELQEYKNAGGIVSEDTETNIKDPLALIYPLARIRKICKLDPEVRGISKEAMLLITKCAELATAKLGQETVRVAQLQNRRKLLPDDVAQVCSNREQFLFLKDDIKDLVKETIPTTKPGATTRRGDSAKEVAAAGSKPLTSYFGATSK